MCEHTITGELYAPFYKYDGISLRVRTLVLRGYNTLYLIWSISSGV